MASKQIKAPLPFLKFVSTAWKYFQKDPATVPTETLELWGQEAEKYPGEFFAWAIEHVKSLDSGRIVLSNPVKVLSELWQQWMKANPKKVERKEFACRSESCVHGFIQFWKRDGRNGRWTPYAARCGHCRKLREPFGFRIDCTNESFEAQMYTEEEIEVNGWLLSNAHNDAEAQKYNQAIFQSEGGFDPSKWRKHYGARGIISEGYERIQESVNAITNDIPF